MPRKSTNSRLAKRLLATNEPPSATEEAELEDIFEEIEEDIHKSVQKILRLQASLKAACEEHAQLLEARTAHRAILSPIRRLPSDLVFEILQWSSTRPSAPSNESFPVVTLNQDEGPWPFMSVCRHWRTVITSHPTFWSNICISYHHNPSFFSNCLQFILDHSKGAPLTLRVDSVPPNLEKDAVRLLVPHSNRWVELSLHCYPEDFCVELEKGLPKGSVPQLRRLSLRNSANIPLTCFEVAPRLQTLKFRSAVLLPVPSLPWDQIRQYSMTAACSVQEVISVLRMMPNLVDCTLNLRKDGNPSTIIRLPHLRRLKVGLIQFRQSTMCVEFLKGLEIPMLEEIDVGQSPEEIDAAVTFISRNACPIRTLSITDSSDSAFHRPRTIEHFIALSKSTPRLTKLTILGSEFQLIEFLRNVTIFPNLNHLSIFTQDQDTEPMESRHFSTVTEIIRSRPLLQLGTLHLSAARISSGKAKRHFERDLHVFRASGLSVSLDLGVADDQKRRHGDSYHSETEKEDCTYIFIPLFCPALSDCLLGALRGRNEPGLIAKPI
ncbi:hypothetical protein C8J56DRAFT_921447 [Mycena floridula]|nr:hypothetical protein C8J56DRAFT_921447 [Mycena floridula]